VPAVPPIARLALRGAGVGIRDGVSGGVVAEVGSDGWGYKRIQSEPLGRVFARDPQM